MKISLPLLPTGICRDQTVHDVEYFTMEHMHEYAEQAIRVALESAAGICDNVINNASRAGLVQHADCAANIGRAIRELKPEIDDADDK